MAFSDHHQNISHQMFRIRHTELNEIFLVMSLRSFVCSMISIFIPIYLYNLGFSLRDILLQNIVMFSVEFVFEYFSAKLRSRFGPKHAIALSMPFLIVHFWLFSTLTTYHWPLWLPAVMGGIHLALYWQGYHYDFSKSKRKGQATRDVSRMYIILAVIGTLAPFVGGWLATNLGFKWLYGAVMLLLVGAFLPLLKRGEKHTALKLDLRKVRPRDIWKDMLAYGGAGIEASASLVSWPLFVYLIVKTYESVGIITSAALLITIFVTYFIGKKVNNANRYRTIQRATYLDGAFYALFILVDSFVQMATLSLIHTAISSVRSAPFTSEYYLHADENSRSEYIFYMESAIDFIKIIAYGTLVLATFFFDVRTVLVLGILFGALGAFMVSLMPRSKCEMPYVKPVGGKIKVVSKLRPKNATN